GAQAGQDFKLWQPEKMSVTAGETLTLACTVSGTGPLGPVKWLKGWGSSNETIYDQRHSSPRGTRAVNESNEDFTILIRDVRPEDAGTYYCVKFRKLDVNDEVFRHGGGTVVSVVESSPFLSMEVAAAVLCFLLLIFILAFCMYCRKQRGEGQSQRVAGVPAGSCLPIPVLCCAGSPRTPRLQSSEVDKDIHYADLQPLPAARQDPGAERSEYASIRGAAK
ncbi:SHPS1 phosphatase, partial [Chauna torquata]|nr:SHPS1 phosphatase [Chauna torquata]